jgi:hypothetical protein
MVQPEVGRLVYNLATTPVEKVATMDSCPETLQRYCAHCHAPIVDNDDRCGVDGPDYHRACFAEVLRASRATAGWK